MPPGPSNLSMGQVRGDSEAIPMWTHALSIALESVGAVPYADTSGIGDCSGEDTPGCKCAFGATIIRSAQNFVESLKTIYS